MLISTVKINCKIRFFAYKRTFKVSVYNQSRYVFSFFLNKFFFKLSNISNFYLNQRNSFKWWNLKLSVRNLFMKILFFKMWERGLIFLI